ncbi:ExbD/TolR family protein [Luteolibacter luteus]|uniref:Biopolymer transporter ExbD n=1 Tax=Luteolibacter luteus TaxID=2728835 RepID=A0A858RKK4_9BACT|nr:biopolymer transporter ExbD [Luteolibacter luteus]QJE97382.1 biopolymer transporter ExbD [Luteolibacter luteus]
MKLETTLPESPGFLIVVPAINLMALMLVFFLPSLFSQSGVALELPVSRFQLERQEDRAVVSITSDTPPVYWLERQQVSFAQLSEKLDARRQGDWAPTSTVLLRVDKGVSVETQRNVAEMALQKGFRVLLLGQSEPSAPSADHP